MIGRAWRAFRRYCVDPWAVTACLVALTTMASGAVAAPDAELWPKWAAHDPASTETVDHSDWDAFLSRYLVVGKDGLNRVAYSKVVAGGMPLLERYLSALARVSVARLDRNEQEAYWINLYNAVTLRVVAGHYPVTSITEIRISPGLFSSGPWGKKLFALDGEELSLDDIEHRILRPIWRDPRLHYAVNCASIGCPNLADRAYTGATVDAMLTAAARAYVNHPRAVAIERGGLVLSKIYDWYRTDFGDSPAAIITHLRRYARPELAEQLERFDAISGYRYDWALNDSASTAPKRE